MTSQPDTDASSSEVVKPKPKKSPAKDPESTASKPAVSTSQDADPNKITEPQAAVSNTDKDKVKDASPSVPQPKVYPVATHADRPGFVKSPYPPFTMLDATGMISGTLARDPATGKIFRVP